MVASTIPGVTPSFAASDFPEYPTVSKAALQTAKVFCFSSSEEKNPFYLAQIPICRAAKSRIISSDPPPIAFTRTSR